MTDTSAEAVERLATLLAAVPFDLTEEDFEVAAATLRALAAKRDALKANKEALEIGVDEAQADRDRLAGENARMRWALEIIAGKRQCIDNLMSNEDVARAALGDARRLSVDEQRVVNAATDGSDDEIAALEVRFGDTRHD
jgi:multidrug resistance efflux pump